MKTFARCFGAGLAASLAVLWSGCSEGGQNEGVFGGGAGAAVGGGIVRTAGMSTAESRATGASLGAASAKAVAVIAKYQATPKQRAVAVARATRAYERMPEKKKAVLREKKVRYVAVDTVRDERAKGDKSVMIWDTQTHEVVGNEVYDVVDPPSPGATVTFETHTAEYVGAGA